ncbi:carboxylesterase family protein [Beauveria brongniartii RCEF 3172]|uniref:Carboxylic ester hydrolase n=1 Tax=Beauveria brongniartii RCEF 3172 TaxID=1081107 RepID=A0A166YMI5_9HYPO|nr:carboxylesterase family protein [Beauveria brongniartii RCEF 3172]
MSCYPLFIRATLWLLITSFSAAASVRRSCSLPAVDLGYEIHQAITLDDGGRYNSSNIRYAAAPVGELRFAAPSPPPVNRATVQIGDEVRICPQAAVGWLQQNILHGIPYVLGPNGTIPPSFAGAVSPVSEDCLFLDVVVPKKVFENTSLEKAPVIVWIYGGGFVNGIKSSSNSGLPGGLLDRAGNNAVYVALNYRLGAFGFLAGASFEDAGGVPNAGLLDQRLALEWVQENIHLFGGDPQRVTVMGESAGGGSILHQITANGGSQGPAYPESVKERKFIDFLQLLNVSSLAEARQVPSEALIQANAEYIAGQPTGGVLPFLPSHDGSFLPDEPATLLAQGRFDQSVDIFVGSNTNDGLYFGDFAVTSDDEFRAWLAQVYSSIRPEDVETLTTSLYPPVFDGSQGYIDQAGRTGRFAQDFLFQCNGLTLAWAKMNQTFTYEFAVSPALHALDIAYTFYNDDPSTVLAPQAAKTLQQYITSFAIDGTPSSPGSPSIPFYGPSGQILVLDTT